MIRKAVKVGGTLYIALTPTVIDELKIKEGDKLDIKLKRKTIVINKIEDKEDKK